MVSTLNFPFPLEGTLSFHVANRILDFIAEDTWTPGTKLPSEPALAEQFGVGRNAIRDAIKILVSSGFLTIRRGEGTYVQDHCTPALLAPTMFDLLWIDITPADLLDFSLASIYTHLHLILPPGNGNALSRETIAGYMEKIDRFVQTISLPPNEVQLEQYWALRASWVFVSSKNSTLIDLCHSEFACLTMRQWDLLRILPDDAQWRELFRLDCQEMEIVQVGDPAAIDKHMEELRAFWVAALKGMNPIPTLSEIVSIGKEVHSSFRRVYRKFAWDILRGIYPPGSHLPSELELCKTLEVSRNSLREVMKCMESIGVVTVVRGDGMYISPHRIWKLIIDDSIFGKILSFEDLISLHELRACVRIGLSWLRTHSTPDAAPNPILTHFDLTLTRLIGSEQKSLTPME